MGRALALKGDSSSHGGTITVSNQDGTVLVEGKEVAVEGATLSCPIHGTQVINGNLADTFKVNGKKVVLNGSTAACSAVIIASATKTFFG